MNVTLRPWRAEDADACVAACNDPLIRRFLPMVPVPYTKEDALAYFAAAQDSRAIVDPSTDRVLGAVGVRPHEDTGEVGYWVAPWARRQGVATAALRVFGTALFAEGFQRLYLRTALPNAASQRVAIAAGYTREGVSRGSGRDRDGSRYDEVVWARLADDPPGPTARLLPDLPDGVLSDGVVTLRPAGPRDTDDILALVSLPEVVARSVPPQVPDRAGIAQHLAVAEGQWLAGERARLTIRDADDDRFAGEISLHYAEPKLQEAMLGYSLAPQHRGRGFAARAVRLVTAWAFEHAGMHRLVAGTAPDNVPSQRVLEAAGFAKEAFQPGRLPGVDGRWVDNVQYAKRR